MNAASDTSSGRENHLKKGSNVSPYEALIAGSLSGAIARGIIAPLDTIKIRLQLQIQGYATYKGASKTFVSICKNEGVKALWKGNVPAEILYILYGAIQFTSYSALSKALSEFEKNNRNLFTISNSTHSLIAGSGSGLASTFFTYPFDLLRTRLAANSEAHFLSMLSTIKLIYEMHGIGGFCKGLTPGLLSVASSTGLMFWSYELAREFSNNYKDVIPFLEGFCGFIAGATAKGLTFPLDTLRKRIQMLSKTRDIDQNSIKAIQLCKTILKNEGIFGFYKGFSISILKSAPTSAISLFTYEYSLSAIKEFTSKHKKL